MKLRAFFMKFFFSACAVILPLFLQVHCNAFKKSADKSVILITLDTQRADYISAYDSSKASTPHIDFFAKNGILFRNCYSPIPITAPAHAVIFYSLAPHELKFYNNGHRLRSTRKTISLPEIYSKHGYETAAFVSLGVLQKKFGLGQGFGTYEDGLQEHRWYLTAQELNDKVLSWLSSSEADKFFLWVHYSDPHFPYAPPSLPPDLQVSHNGQQVYEFCVQKVENITMRFPIKPGKNTIQFKVLNSFPEPKPNEFRVSLNNIEFIHSQALQMDFEKTGFAARGEKRSLLLEDEGIIQVHNPGKLTELTIKAQGNMTLLGSEKGDQYQKEVEYMDQQVGFLTTKLRELGLLDRCIVILAGDHGEGLGEYKTALGNEYFGHIHYLQDVYMKVPLIIFDPSRKKSHTVEEIVSLFDVAPTLLDMMGWEKIPFHKGRNLLKLKKDESYFLLQETYTPEAIHDCFGGQQYPWHLIFTPAQNKFELYNMESDPSEKHDVFDDNKNDQVVVGLIRSVQKRALDILENKHDVPINKKYLEMLRALGYIK